MNTSLFDFQRTPINLVVGLVLVLTSFAGLAIAQPAPVQAPTPPIDLYSAQDLGLAQQGMATAIKSELAYELIASLTTEVGPRPAGSEADPKAVAWAEARLRALGFDRVWTEPVQIDAWRRIAAHADLVTPYPHHLAVTALGNSISTPATGIQADVAYYANIDALRKDTSDRARGRIVFIDGTFARTQDGGGYGPAVSARVNGAIEAGKRGALAVVIRSIGTDQDRLPHTGAMRYDAAIAPPIPAAAVSTPDADLIRRIATTPDRSTGQVAPLRLSLNLQNVATRNLTTHNVYAEIRGQAKPDDIVAIGGHLDSWDLGTGAIDDGAGVAITIAAAKIILDFGIRPKRTIRVILFGNEENGLDGARSYAKKYGQQRHQLASESDLGADRVYRLHTRVDEKTRPWLKAIADVIAPLGITFGDNNATGGPDFGPLTNQQDHPVATLAQDATRYFDIHHTANDTLDKINPTQLNQNVAAWVAMVWLAAQADHDFKPAPRKTP